MKNLQILFTAVFIFLFQNAFSQEDIRKSTQGVYLGTDFVDMFGKAERAFVLDARYFREDRIAPAMTLHSFAGVQNRFLQSRYGYDAAGYGTGLETGYGFVNEDSPMRAYYDLNLQIGTEFRWYFGQRFMKSRKVTVNGGWFLGVPLTFSVDLLHQPRLFIWQWMPESFRGELSLAAKAGYRYAFNEYWFAEASLSYVPAAAEFYGGRGSDIRFHEWAKDMFKLELKAAYTF